MERFKDTNVKNVVMYLKQRKSQAAVKGRMMKRILRKVRCWLLGHSWRLGTFTYWKKIEHWEYKKEPALYCGRCGKFTVPNTLYCIEDSDDPCWIADEKMNTKAQDTTTEPTKSTTGGTK